MNISISSKLILKIMPGNIETFAILLEIMKLVGLVAEELSIGTAIEFHHFLSSCEPRDMGGLNFRNIQNLIWLWLAVTFMYNYPEAVLSHLGVKGT